MADHADAIPSKEAGKGPRVPRGSRSTATTTTHTNTAVEGGGGGGNQQKNQQGKRKNTSNHESNREGVRESKVPKVDRHHQNPSRGVSQSLSHSLRRKRDHHSSSSHHHHQSSTSAASSESTSTSTSSTASERSSEVEEKQRQKRKERGKLLVRQIQKKKEQKRKELKDKKRREKERSSPTKDPVSSRLRKLPGRSSLSASSRIPETQTHHSSGSHSHHSYTTSSRSAAVSSSSSTSSSSKSKQDNRTSSSLSHSSHRSQSQVNQSQEVQDSSPPRRRLTRSATTTRSTSEESQSQNPTEQQNNTSRKQQTTTTTESQEIPQTRYRDRLRSGGASSLNLYKIETRKSSGSGKGSKSSKVASEHQHDKDKAGEGGGGRKGRSFWLKGSGSRGSGGPQAQAATSSATGSCASSRCGRGAAASGASNKSAEDPFVKSSEEQGMNNSSNTNNNPPSSSGGGTSSKGGGGETGAGEGGGQGGSGSSATSGAPTSGGTSSAASSAASAFSRTLGMLSGIGGGGSSSSGAGGSGGGAGGEADTDESEMGRLQALLESRGLPPHLFGSLAPRMQQLLHRGMSASSGNVTKAQQLLQGLQATGDEGQQLQAAIEMCQLLVMGNEDTLAGFPVKQTVAALITLLSMEHNFDMMNHASRALTYMMEALPRSTPVVAEAIPVFLEKLQVIQCMDVAEQSLTALEMLSRRHAKAILQAKGVGTCLTFLDFFSIVAQRASLSITANCMQNLHVEEFSLVADSLGFMASRLTVQDKKSVESVCLAFSRLIDSMLTDKGKLEEIASTELLANLQQLLVVTPPVVSTATFILVLRMLAQLCSRCPSVAVKLLEQNIVGTLSSLLLGSSVSKPTEEVELVKRNPQELLEIINVIAELLPKLPKDGIFSVNHMIANPQTGAQDAVQWQWKDDRGQWSSYSVFDSRIIEAAHQAGDDEISLSMHGRAYTVDFLGMQQINEDTGTARTVQRKVNPFVSLKADGSHTESEEDERSAFLSRNPDFAIPFLRPLFALMSEANSSSAGPAVRTSCLKTLLRLVYFLPGDSLQKILKPQSISNTLASTLGSSDLKIVIGAFQLCWLFMDKLRDSFFVHFKREGVFHQISRISASEIVAPSPVKADASSSVGGGTSSTSEPAGTAVITSSVSVNLGTVGAPTTSSSTSSLLSGIAVGSTASGVIKIHDNIGSISTRSAAAAASASSEGKGKGSGSSGGVTSRSSNADLTSEVPPGGGSASSEKVGRSSGGGATTRTSSHHDQDSNNKKEEEARFDVCKRKRVSKRTPPASTSRRLRQEDFSGALPSSGGASGGGLLSSSSGSPPASSSSSSSTKQTAKRTGKSGFFASLHPSRWASSGGGGGGGSSSAGHSHITSSINNNNVNVPPKNISRPFYTVETSTVDRTHPYTSHHQMTASYAGQMKSWLKEQSTAFTVKYYRPSSSSDGFGLGLGGSSDSLKMDDMSVMPKLNEIITNLKNDTKIMEALRDLRTVVLESDVSSFEINQSGLIPAMTTFFTEEKGYKNSREVRIRSFLHVFADCPLDQLSGDKLDAFLIGSAAEGKFTALCSFISKLHSCLSQLEQFEVKVHEVPAHDVTSRSAAPTSALRFFNTHQLKCNLQRHPSCNTLRQWKGGPVKIDSLALVQTIERYLLAKGFGRIRESRDSGDSEDDNSDEEMDEALASSVVAQGGGRHKIQFLIGDSVLPYTMTVYQAIRQYGSSVGSSADHDPDFDPAVLISSSSIWSQTHTIYYRPVPEETGGAGTSSSSQSALPLPYKKKSKSSSKSSSKNKKDKDVVWNEGLVPDPVPPYQSFLTPNLPDAAVTISDPCLPVLNLLRIVHAVCRHWRYLYWPVCSTQPLLNPSEFINTKVAAKAQRLVQDPVVILAGTVPLWLQQIGLQCPFLFPFETRHMLFYSITFDRDRALQRLLDSVPELNGVEREDRIIPRLDRRKRTISRENILHHAEQLMTDFSSSRPLLEIQYENEVGTGLGPTLEFYALVSQEMQKRELDLWHNENDLPETTKRKADSPSFVQTSCGLFPKPVGKSVKANHLTKVKNKFKFLGKFAAKALMDSRLIDLPLSKAMYKWILNGENSLTLADIADVDSTIGRSIRQLVNVVCDKKKIEKGKSVELLSALESLTLDGCKIDSLGLDFTLPGHPSMELKKGGRNILVTIHNLEEYIKLVCHWMLVGGIQRQMESFREGFDSVFPSSSMKIFYPEELDLVFCGANQNENEHWDFKNLMDSCRADHGYTLDSRAIQFLFQIMSSYNHAEKRSFLQFVTGSPRLPVGGFKVLQPQLTIVRKTIENSPEKTDECLPSVMTCVNYLKLPDYSSLEILRDRLRVAIDEGQLSFHLS